MRHTYCFAVIAMLFTSILHAADEYSPLQLATARGDIDQVEQLLLQGHDPDGDPVDYPYAGTPLATAAAVGNLPMVKLLIQHGAQAHRKKQTDGSILFTAISSGDIELLEYLLSQKLKMRASWTQKGKFEKGHLKGEKFSVTYSMFDAAVRSNSVEMARYLVAKGQSAKKKNSRGESPIHTAMYWADGDMIDYLISQGADVNAKDSYGLRPLQRLGANADLLFASRAGMGSLSAVDRARRLVKAGARIEDIGKGTGPGSLMWQAVNGNNLELVKWLVEIGVKKDYQNPLGESLLNNALAKSHAGVALYLSEQSVPLGGVRDYHPMLVLRETEQEDTQFDETLTRLYPALEVSSKNPSNEGICKVMDNSYQWVLIQGQCDGDGYALGPGISRSLPTGNARDGTPHLYVGNFENGMFEDNEAIYYTGKIYIDTTRNRANRFLFLHQYGNGAESIYRGSFRNHESNGEAVKWQFSSRELISTYRGPFVNGQRAGEGVYATTSGFRYEGGFRGDEFHGDGILFDPYELEAVGGLRGSVEQIITSKYYDGHFENGLFSGQGQFIRSTGEQYAGKFRDGSYHGHGAWQHANGMSFIGSFAKGQPVGRATATWSDGRRFEGDFKGGAQTLGVMHFPDGRQVQGLLFSGDYSVIEPYDPNDPRNTKLGMLKSMFGGAVLSAAFTGDINSIAKAFAKQTINYSMDGLQRGLVESGNGNIAQIVQMTRNVRGGNIDEVAQSLARESISYSLQGVQQAASGSYDNQSVQAVPDSRSSQMGRMASRMRQRTGTQDGISVSAPTASAPSPTPATANSAASLNNRPDSDGTRFFPHKIQCDDGQQHDVKIPYKSERCLFALKQFSEVMACNVVSKIQMAQEDCSRMCGRADCYEE